VTREILAWPDVENWALRLSVAEIERDGPFSAFPGVDRWFAVLSGSGVRIGEPFQTITAGSSPLQFDGATAPQCMLIDGPTRDLNLMLRRNRAGGSMARVTSHHEWPGAPGDSGQYRPSTDIRGVFTVGGCTLSRADGQSIEIPPMSAAWCTAVNTSDTWTASVPVSDCPTFAFHCAMRGAPEAIGE
jgi:hypothetical protein